MSAPKGVNKLKTILFVPLLFLLVFMCAAAFADVGTFKKGFIIHLGSAPNTIVVCNPTGESQANGTQVVCAAISLEQLRSLSTMCIIYSHPVGVNLVCNTQQTSLE
jgi:hypothetical protein